GDEWISGIGITAPRIRSRDWLAADGASSRHPSRRAASGAPLEAMLVPASPYVADLQLGRAPGALPPHPVVLFAAAPLALLPGCALGTPPPPAAVCTSSRGSKNHFRGQCRPCRFHEAPEKCPRGEDCNFCHFPHGEEKFAKMDAFSTKARMRRPRRGAAPGTGPPGQRLSLCDHLDLAGSWSGGQRPAAASGLAAGPRADAPGPAHGAAWQAFGAAGTERPTALLPSAPPECCVADQGQLADQPGADALGAARGAAWQALGAADTERLTAILLSEPPEHGVADKERLKAILVSAQPEHYDD
ncbi:unnamed protein product, partial [Prorocentrum cordatum]